LPEKIRSYIPISVSKSLARATAKAYETEDKTQAERTAFAHLRHDLGVAKVKDSLTYITEKFEDTDEQAVIFAYHTDVIHALQEGLTDHAVITGATSQADRQKAIESFQSGTIKYLIGNVLAAGTGITLTKARHAVFVEIDVTPANNWQAEDRIHRIGQNSTCYYHYLCAEKSMDDQLFKIVNKKEEAIIKVMGERK